MLRFLEGSKAIAETIKLCRPQVVAIYPITPQTHIVENLAMFKANGFADYEYIRAESEFAAASMVLGASATGVRTYTASASQGLLLMTEVLFNIAGLRLPVVMTSANRAVSAPINIWNDQQDAMTIRDAGWVMLFAETNQEAVDLHIQAYKIAERTNLPVMVCVDGFSLTHTSESVNIPDQKLVDKFLPKLNRYRIPTPSRYPIPVNQYLDPQNPTSLGVLSTPENYMPLRLKLHKDLLASKQIIKKTASDFNKLFKKQQITRYGLRVTGYDGLVEYTGPKNPKLILVAMGSVLGTIRHTVFDRNPIPIRNRNQIPIHQIGILKIKCFRPFPDEEIAQIILKTKPKNIAVIDRAISLGRDGILLTELQQTLFKCGNIKTKAKNFILGLGGKDIRPEDILKIIKDIS